VTAPIILICSFFLLGVCTSHRSRSFICVWSGPAGSTRIYTRIPLPTLQRVVSVPFDPFSRFSRTPACDRQTDGHRTMSYTTLCIRVADDRVRARVCNSPGAVREYMMGRIYEQVGFKWPMYLYTAVAESGRRDVWRPHESR